MKITGNGMPQPFFRRNLLQKGKYGVSGKNKSFPFLDTGIPLTLALKTQSLISRWKKSERVA